MKKKEKQRTEDLKQKIMLKEATVTRNRLMQIEEKQERLLLNFSIKDQRVRRA